MLMKRYSAHGIKRSWNNIQRSLIGNKRSWKRICKRWFTWAIVSSYHFTSETVSCPHLGRFLTFLSKHVIFFVDLVRGSGLGVCVCAYVSNINAHPFFTISSSVTQAGSLCTENVRFGSWNMGVSLLGTRAGNRGTRGRAMFSRASTGQIHTL